MSETSLCMVVLTKRELPEPMVLAKALAAARKTPLQDQVRTAKKAWGIVAENVKEDEAKTLVERLDACGIASAAMPMPALVPLPEVRALKQWDPSLTDGAVLIAAAGMTVTSTTTQMVKEGPSTSQKILSTAIMLGTGLPIKIGGKERTVEKRQEVSDRLFYADLFYKDPLRRWRVDAMHFDYSFLKERKLYQVFGNFKLLVSDFAQAVPPAWRNHGASVLLEGKPIQTMGYESIADLERECRWLLTLQNRPV
jgi:hypothetical protein